MDVKSTWIPIWHQMDHVSWLFGFFFETTSWETTPHTRLGDHVTLNAHNRWFNLYCHVWGPAWIKVRWSSIRSRAWSHMTSHYTGGSMGPRTWPVPGSASHQSPSQVAGVHWPQVRWLVAGCLGPTHGGPAPPPLPPPPVYPAPPASAEVKRRWRIAPALLSGAGRNPPGCRWLVDDFRRRPPSC